MHRLNDSFVPGMDAGTHWRTHLLTSSQQLQSRLRRHVNVAHQNAILCAALAAVECACCRIKKYKLDVVQLLCCPERRPRSCPYKGQQSPPHVVCHACMAKLAARTAADLQHMERQELRHGLRQTAAHETNSQTNRISTSTGLRTEHADETREEGISFLGDTDTDMTCAEAQATQFVRRLAVRIVLCPLCKSPNVVWVKAVFSESLQRTFLDRGGTITQYQVAVAATKLLQDNYTIEEVYENHRRHLFGAFSRANLLNIDFRGPYSTQDGCPLPHTHEKPNKRWVWIEVDAPDTTLPASGRDGWMYRHHWSDKLRDYNRDVSLFHLVRTRRLLHTRIRLSDEVKAELRALHEEIIEEAEDTLIRTGAASTHANHSTTKK